MSNAKRFEELLRSDEAMQAKLKAAIEGYEGDKTDEREAFDSVVAPLAAEAGLPFTFEEGLASAEEGAELSDAELDAVAGGDGFCVLAGLTDDVDAESGYGVVRACAILGISFG
ncbi:MAG: hypothetical protein IJI12_01795 [Atopobiaceae bacterium]|nr:hypothetical protein [Atopobiaceae bacterium]